MKQIWAISDIHGHHLELCALLRKILPIQDNTFVVPKDVLMVFCGDYIDRGDSPDDVLMLLNHLKTTYPENVVLLMGNHDWKLARIAKGREVERKPELEDTLEVLREANISNDWLNKFFEKVDFFYEYEDYIFVHAQYKGIPKRNIDMGFYDQFDENGKKKKKITQKDQESVAMYGTLNSNTPLPDGKPDRKLWWQDYDGRHGTIIFGHYQVVAKYPYAIGIDGGVFNPNGRLVAYEVFSGLFLEQGRL